MDMEDMKKPIWRTREIRTDDDVNPIWLFEHAVEWQYSADATTITLHYLSTKPMPVKVKAEEHSP